MKKIIFFLLSLILVCSVYPQVRVKFKLMNPGVDAQGKYYLKLVAVVQPGQTWRVGSSNIRVDFHTVPATNVLTVAPDSVAGTVQEPLACINSGNYGGLTTTAINNRTAISFNITRLNACCTLSTGTYILGRLRFNRIDTTGCTIDTIRYTSVVQDSITAWAHGTQWTDSNFTTCLPLVGIGGTISEIPKVFKLYTNYPNPFNPVTTIRYDVPRATNMKIVIYDILGKEVDILVNGYIKPGSHEVKWDATNYASGTYFYRFESDAYTEVKKMSVVK